MLEPKPLRVCATCPWLTGNHRKKHPAGWYNVGNLRRLWNGLRTGKAPGMICHSSDPNSPEYGGKGDIKPGQEHECAGALTLIFANVNAFGENQPQPFQPPMKKPAIADFVYRKVIGDLPAVEDRRADISLPW